MLKQREQQKTAPILEYPLPARPYDVIDIEVLQLPRSHEGSSYVLVCVDHFSRFTVLAPLPNKSATTLAHALVSHLICPFSSMIMGQNLRIKSFKIFVTNSVSSRHSLQQIILHLMTLLNAQIEKYLKFFATLQESSMNHGKIGSPVLLPPLMAPLTLPQVKLHITLYMVLTNAFHMTCWCTPLSLCTP